MLVKVRNLSRNVLEMRGRYVVVFQVEVPQISLIRQLVRYVLESFTVSISAQNRDFFLSLTRFS